MYNNGHSSVGYFEEIFLNLMRAFRIGIELFVKENKDVVQDINERIEHVDVRYGKPTCSVNKASTLSSMIDIK